MYLWFGKSFKFHFKSWIVLFHLVYPQLCFKQWAVVLDPIICIYNIGSGKGPGKENVTHTVLISPLQCLDCTFNIIVTFRNQSYTSDLENVHNRIGVTFIQFLYSFSWVMSLILYWYNTVCYKYIQTFFATGK